MVMEFIDKNFDDYSRKARLTPALIVSFPLVLTAISAYPDSVFSLGGICGLLGWFGVLPLISQIARDRGNAIQGKLYEDWGGEPTTYLLRHRSSENKIQLARWHNKLYQLTNQAIPSQSEESTNPDLADKTYAVWTTFLRNKTRDCTIFPLVYRENCNYGFRRNLLGMKRIARAIAIASTIFILGKCATIIGLFDLIENWQRERSTQVVANNLSSIVQNWLWQGDDSIHKITDLKFSNIPLPLNFCIIIDVFLLIFWLWQINSNWVKATAYAYANRLLEASENLS
jgi:hypothetical protein